MKKVTTVLTLTALAASLIAGTPSAQAQSAPGQTLPALLSKGYDPAEASNALAASSDAAALLNAVNAARKSNGLCQLTVDPALSAAAMYQEADQLKRHYSASYAYLANGVTTVSPAAMAADFGSAATGVQEFSYGNGINLADTGNWPALETDWQRMDAGFSAALDSASVNVCGLDLVDTGSQSGGDHVYKWVLVTGYSPNAAAPPPLSGQTLPALLSKGYDPAEASNALAASSDAAALLNAVNAARKSNGLCQLTVDPALSAAAMYQEADQLKRHYSASYAYLANGVTTVSPAAMAADFGSAATGVQEFSYGNGINLADTGNWPALETDWQRMDAGFSAALDSASVNVCGLDLVDTGSQSGGDHVYKWVLVTGYNSQAVTTGSTGSTGSPVNLTGLNQMLAAKALATPPSATETMLLGVINAYRARIGKPLFQIDPALNAAAYYEAYGNSPVSPATLAADFGSQRSSFINATGASTLFNNRLVALPSAGAAGWTTIMSIWRVYCPSYQSLVADATYNHVGLRVVDTGTKAVNPTTGLSYEVYGWVLLGGR